MCDRFCVSTEIPYTGAPSHPVPLAAKRLESKNRFVRSKGLGSREKVCGGRVINPSKASEDELGSEFWKRGHNTKKHLKIMTAHVGVNQAYKLGAGKHRGYDLYWNPGTYHKRTPEIIQELDYSMLNNLRTNPLAGPLPPIPTDALQEHEFQDGCDTINKCGTKSCETRFGENKNVPKQPCANRTGDLPLLPGFSLFD